MDEEIELGEEATTWSAIGAAVLVAATWALLFVGVVSFGPGSVAVAALVFAVGGVGFVLSPFVPFAVRPRAVALVVLVIGAVALALVAGRFTPPTEARMRAVLDDTMRGVISSADRTLWAQQRVTPWEAPATSSGGEVRAENGTALASVVAALERRGWDVEVLRPEADGLRVWFERDGGSIPWDLAAHRDRYELRAAFRGAQLHTMLAWQPLVRTADPFQTKSVVGFFGWLGAGAFLTTVAAIAAMVGIVLTLASVGLTVWAVARVARDDRPYRHGPTGEDTGS